MIVVTGATGHLGRLVIAELLERVPASELVAAVRRPENAGALSEAGVTVRACDYDNVATLAEAFEPGDRILLISSNDFVNSVAQHMAVVQAARAADASLLAYTSLLNAGESRLIVAQAHRATEPIIRESGVPYTLLRNNLLAAAAAVLTQPGHEGKTYELSGDVPWSSSDLVKTLSAISGTNVRLRELSSAEQRGAIEAAGFPRPVADVFVNT
jgi:NAD(P)H dehydrogenase (quinone)